MRQLIDANNLIVTSRREIAFIHNDHVSVMSSPPKDINEDTNAYNPNPKHLSLWLINMLALHVRFPKGTRELRMYITYFP